MYDVNIMKDKQEAIRRRIAIYKLWSTTKEQMLRSRGRASGGDDPIRWIPI